jgi:hypothetical protein
MFRYPKSISHVVNQRHVVFKAILYFNKEFAGDLQMNALRTLHPMMKSEGFREKCLNDHKFTVSTFDSYSKEALRMFNDCYKQANVNWADFANACGSITAFLTAFPERTVDFRSIIIDLIQVIKEKTDLARKNAAVLLSKLAQDEENSKIMRANHGYDVLMSLRNQFM